jgi:hypothetical protein
VGQEPNNAGCRIPWKMRKEAWIVILPESTNDLGLTGKGLSKMLTKMMSIPIIVFENCQEKKIFPSAVLVVGYVRLSLKNKISSLLGGP